MSRSTTILLASVLVAASACRTRERADLVLYNGKVVTVDPEFRVVEALAVKGDRILAVGSNRQMLELAADGAERVDLEGKTVLPGLIDSHTHPVGAAMYEFDHEVPEMESIADVLAYVKRRAETLEDGEWIVVSQVFITRLKEQRYPTRQELDRAAPRNPVVFRTGPDASLNSLALKLSGIDRNFQITDGLPGRIERDPRTGEPTGIVRSAARFIKIRPSGKQPTREDYLRRLKLLLADYNSVGITSIVDGDASDQEVELYRTLKERGELSCRTFLALSVDAQMPMEKIRERLRRAAASPLHRYDAMLWLKGAKSYLDGGMLTGSAYMRKPWGVSRLYAIDDPNYRGMLYIEPEKLYQIMREALAVGLQFTAHSVGDGAVHAFLEAAERVARNDFPLHDKRPVITHSNFMSLEAVRKMAELGVGANMQPAWLWLDAATLVRQFGYERLAFFQPYRTIFEHRAMAGGGSDHMQKIGSMHSINPYNPFFGIWITLTRRARWMEKPLHPDEIITREQAIRFYTINNAWLTFEETQKGSLEPGKLADFILLDRDILSCPLEEIKDIQVQKTWLGGKLVFDRQAHPPA